MLFAPAGKFLIVSHQEQERIVDHWYVFVVCCSNLLYKDR